MANTNKMTKVQVFAEAINIIRAAELAGVDNENFREVIEGLSHEIDLLNTKAEKAKSGDTKAAQRKREEQYSLISKILDVMRDGKRRTATQIANAVGISVQKASAFLKIMIASGSCSKDVVKKVSYFFIDGVKELV